jgi:hypothetical protein
LGYHINERILSVNKIEFLEKVESQRERIHKRYGSFMYYFIVDLFNINYISQLIETNKDYKTVRISSRLSMVSYDEIYYQDNLIGTVRCMGSFPEVTFYKNYRKHALKFKEHAIAPIMGVHRVLEWHEIKSEKLHCLAGGETILHFMPIEINNKKIDSFIKENKLEKLLGESLRMEGDTDDGR